jgi:hypothetical protein
MDARTAAAVSDSTDPTVCALVKLAQKHAPAGGYGATAWQPSTGTVCWIPADWSSNDEVAAAEEEFLAVDGVERFAAEAEAPLPSVDDGWLIIYTPAPMFASATTAPARFPLKPPAAWFEIPEPDHPMPLTVEADGRVHGHLAPWDGCHTGFPTCVPPPRNDDFELFHVGQLETAEGSMVPIGKVVYNGKHASLDAPIAAASRHYDDNGHVGAYVRARAGQHGIWLSGVVKSDISEEALRDLRANPPSGDWRDPGGRGLRLIAALAVPVPGYPIPQMAMAASGEVVSLVLPGYCECDEEEATVESDERSKGYIRQRSRIASSLAEVDGRLPIEEDMILTADEAEALTAAATTFTAAQRRQMAKSGVAMPDGSFPIRNCQDFMDARRSIGRAPAGKRARVTAHISSRGKALGCKTD